MFDVILCATDGSWHGARAVHVAARLAVSHDARLLVAHVQGRGDIPEPLRRLAEVEYQLAHERLGGTQVANVSGGLSISEQGETAAHREQLHRLIAERIVRDAEKEARELGAENVRGIVVEEGTPAEGIVDLAAAESADLIVIGARGLSQLKGLIMGSVSHEVCARALCSCLTVK